METGNIGRDCGGTNIAVNNRFGTHIGHAGTATKFTKSRGTTQADHRWVGTVGGRELPDIISSHGIGRTGQISHAVAAAHDTGRIGHASGEAGWRKGGDRSGGRIEHDRTGTDWGIGRCWSGDDKGCRINCFWVHPQS